MSVKDVTKSNFSKVIYNNPEKPVMISFSNGTNPNSKKQDMFLTMYSYEHPDVLVGRIDVEKEPSLSAMYGIQTVPSIKIFKKGKCTATASGLQDKFHLHQLMTK